MEHNKRIIYLDYLRIVAMLSVIVIHVSASRLNTQEVGSSNWIIMNIYNKAMGYAVPCFIMISGAVSFKRDVEIKELYQKKILRIIIAYLFWNVFYALSHNVARPLLSGQPMEWETFIDEIVIGRYHLWYCRMIIGIYILIPIMSSVTRNEKLLKYTLTILFFFSILIPAVKEGFVWKWLEGITQNVGLENGKYMFYFLLGYYLANVYHPGNKEKYKIIGIGILAEIILSFGATFIIVKSKTEWYSLLQMNEILVVLASCGVFILFQSFFENKDNKFIAKTSSLCFGIYLVHDYFVGGIDSLGLTTVSFNVIISIPVIVGGVFVLSLITAYICNKIPFIGKYIT